MFKLVKYLLSVVALVLISITVPAQTNLPRLQEDKAVRRGTLASGITYYIIENPVVKGRADAALVRRGEEMSELQARQLSAFSPFLLRSGISPDAGGYIQSRGGSTVFSFPSVAVHETAVLDSTLLMLFSLARESKADEALIISGDVSAQAIKAKMDIFSLMIPQRNIGVRQDTHVWQPNPAPQWEFTEGCSGDRSTIRVSYSAPRLPQNRLNTSQAVIPGLFASYFQPFIRRRLARSFQARGIPYASIGFGYRGTADSPGDEIYTVQVVTDTAHTSAALNTIALVLGAADDFGAGTGELRDIRNSLRQRMLEMESEKPVDAVYVERCVSHFLYGTNLAPAKETVNLAVRRQVTDSTWAALFNSYNSAWLGRLSNMNLEIATGIDSLDTDQVIFDYNLHYLIGSTAGDPTPYAREKRDSVPEYAVSNRVRLRETRVEPVSGGEMWSYSNGMKVIYRNMPGVQGFSYAVIWQGGMDCVDALERGEGAFIAEMFPLFGAGGLNCRDFRDMLDSEGISMEANLRLKNFIIRGWSPSEQLPLLMESLLGITTEGTIDKADFDYWRSCRALLEDDVESHLSSVLLPDFNCIPEAVVASLSDKTLDKALAFYKDRFSRMNEATLIIIGNVEEQALKKELSRNIGSFRTQNGITPRRPIRYKFRGGHQLMHTREGERCLHAQYQAEMSLSAVNYFASMALEEWLNRALPRALAKHGLSVSARVSFLAWLQERVSIKVECVPMPEESLPEGVSVAPSEQWPILLDRALRDLDAPGAQELNVYKERVGALIAAEMEDPEGLMDMVLLRQAYGKDFVLNSKSNIASVDAARLRSIMTAISGGSNVKIMSE